ncbi:MAG: glycosyltransferase [Pseudomonadales bacterium]|jgi:glycosyltransferase involved in cell wall biosynthesis|nr:glycosyltransferase [Pseudomonadales bacterium]
MAKNKTSPLVSVIIPAYDAEQYIDVAIESILKQTYPNFELILINDGSRDTTLKKMNAWKRKDRRIKIINNIKNLGVATACNLGIKTATGKYLARLDADDWSYPNRIAKQVTYLEKHPKVVLLGSAMEICDHNLRSVDMRHYPRTDQLIRKRIFSFNPFCSSSVMMKTDILKQVDGYDSAHIVCEDYDLYFRLGMIGRLANLANVLVKHRTISNSLTHRKIKKMAEQTIKIANKYTSAYQANWQSRIFLFISSILIVVIPNKALWWLSNKLQNSGK